MSDQLSGGLVLGVAGAAVGAFFGFPGLGFAVGSAVGGLLFPPENRLPDVTGPRLNDLVWPGTLSGQSRSRNGRTPRPSRPAAKVAARRRPKTGPRIPMT